MRCDAAPSATGASPISTASCRSSSCAISARSPAPNTGPCNKLLSAWTPQSDETCDFEGGSSQPFRGGSWWAAGVPASRGRPAFRGPTDVRDRKTRRPCARASFTATSSLGGSGVTPRSQQMSKNHRASKTKHHTGGVKPVNATNEPRVAGDRRTGWCVMTVWSLFLIG